MEHKSLGALIDETLKWSNHINAITKKISSGVGSIKRKSHCVPPATLHTAARQATSLTSFRRLLLINSDTAFM